MDPRRLLMLALAAPLLSGCAILRDLRPAMPVAPAAPAAFAEALAAVAVIDEITSDTAPEPVHERPLPAADAAAPSLGSPLRAIGRPAIAEANAEARAASRSDSFIGGVQVFAWSPGRIYEVWTAPLRVTTLTLGPGESLVSKAAGDTVRWQIGETASGEGAGQRRHVLIKPLQQGLETNLVLTTNRRVYFLDLRSGGVDSYNAAVAWDANGFDTPAVAPPGPSEDDRGPDPVAMPAGPVNARYSIEARGRRPRWSPVSVFDDGLRTYIAFPADLQVDEAPALFILAADGEAQMVNYRQAGGLFIVDRLFDRAELRLGDRRPHRVRLRRLEGAAR